MRLIISIIVIIILIFFLLLLINSTFITETFITKKDLEDIKNYQGKVTDTYDTIDKPISDSLIPYNPKDTIKINDYDIIEIYKYIYERPPTIQELKKYVYYTKDELKEFLYNSPEYDKLIKTQNNDVNNGIEGAIAKKNLINRIILIYSTIYKDDLPVKMMVPLRDCFIHLQLNEFLFTAMLESYNYKKFEVDVLSTYVLTKKVLLQLFNKHFNVLELKLIAQEKINNTNNQTNIVNKEIENIKKDLISVSSSSDKNIVKNIIDTVKLNYPTVYNELVKATIKNGGTEDTITTTTDINQLNQYLSKIEKYQNMNSDSSNTNTDISNTNTDTSNTNTDTSNTNTDTYNTNTNTDTYNTNTYTYNTNTDTYNTNTDTYNTNTDTYNTNIDSFNNYDDKSQIIEKLELNKKTKDKIKKLNDNAELYVRVYEPIVHNNSYILPSGYKPPICTSLGQEQMTQPVFTESKLLFQGTDLNTAFKNTQVGSIMPKFIYKEYTDVKLN